MATHLDQSYNWCYRVARDSGSSFYRAFWLLDRQQRLAMFALYAFARVTDDLGDDLGDDLENDLGILSPPISVLPVGHPVTATGTDDPTHLASNASVHQAADPTADPATGTAIPVSSANNLSASSGLSKSQLRLARLVMWSRMLSDRLETSVLHFSGNDSIDLTIDAVTQHRLANDLAQYDLLWPALRDTIMRYGIPPSLLQELIGGVALDVGTVRMHDWQAVEDYSYRVAATVGLACLRIWQAADTLSPQQAIDCGVAFQLTNILRDVREDARQDRIYLPATELDKFGCSPQAWLALNPDGDWQGLVTSTIARARSLYESGRHTIDHLPPKGQRIFYLMWNSYRQLLELIAQNQTQLWSGQRLTLSPWKRTGLLLSALMRRPRTNRGR